MTRIRSRRRLFAVLSAVVAASLALHAQGISSKDLLDGLANPTRWLTYSGDYSGRRHSPLTQITPANAGQLAAQWTFQTGVAGKFEATPIVVDGVLYVGRAAEQRVGDRRPDRATDLALSAAGAGGCEGVLRPRQSRLRDPRRSGVHGHARCPPRGARYEDRQGRLGHRDRRLRRAMPAPARPLIVKDKIIDGHRRRRVRDPRISRRVRRSDRQACVALLDDSRARRARAETWPNDVSSWERGGAPTWLSGSYDPELNTGLLGHRQSEPRFLRRRPQGRQPVFGIARRSRRRYGHAQVALPVHAARHARLGRESDPRARRPHARRRAAQSGRWSPIATAFSTCSIA